MMLSSERTIELSEGAATIVESWGTSGPVILCVHGIASSRRSWARLGETFATSYRVFAYDQRGHGDSAHVTGPMTLERSVADAGEVARALPAPVDVVIGHSWGGAVAILFGAELRPSRVVAIDPMLRVEPGTFQREYVDDLRETLGLEGAAKEAAIRRTYAGSHESDVEAKVHAMSPMDIGVLERLDTENHANAGSWDLREAVGDYPVPLLVLAAGEDSVLTPADRTLLIERGGPNVAVRVFEGQGHNLLRSAFAEFVSVVRDFI